jgi:hypothetical protein
MFINLSGQVHLSDICFLHLEVSGRASTLTMNLYSCD